MTISKNREDDLRKLQEHAIEEYESGKNLQEIGEQYGFSGSTVLHILQYLGVSRRSGTPIRHGHNQVGHRTGTYNSWDTMIQRCTNPRNDNYRNYGARGITVCERWLIFANFLADMGERPEGLTLDRLDNSKGYAPENCKWITRKEQLNNKRTNVVIEYMGKSQTLAQWAVELGVDYMALWHKYRRKGTWPPK
jgi:hypothetical protein